MRQDIDIPVFTQIIRENPTVEFHLWGAYQTQSSNFGGGLHPENARFVEFLRQASNVVLHGMVSPDVLATAIQNMDAFLICYDIDKDQSKGTNYHKIMEYLSTGKVIVSNNVSTYKDRPDLIQMVVERKNNEKILPLLKKIMKNLEIYNSIKSQNIRIEFALGNKYLDNLFKIDEIISRKTRK